MCVAFIANRFKLLRRCLHNFFTGRKCYEWYLIVLLWRYLTRELIWHNCQSSMRPSIYFSLIVKSISNPFLEPTSTKAIRVKFIPQGNNGRLWWDSNSWLSDHESHTLPIAPRRPLYYIEKHHSDIKSI